MYVFLEGTKVVTSVNILLGISPYLYKHLPLSDFSIEFIAVVGIKVHIYLHNALKTANVRLLMYRNVLKYWDTLK